MGDYHQWIGLLGTALILGTYLMLQLKRISSEQLAYSVLNGVGALMLVFSLCFNFNLAAFIVEVFWAAISAVGIVQHFKAREKR
jgi:ABC-type amino acid transport system permease subunit